MELGAREYIVKPLSYAAFLRMVNDLVNRWDGITAGFKAV